MKKTMFSGVQSSGQPSLGNLLGAFKQFVTYQESHNAYFCVVDHHAITVRQQPEKLHENSYAIAAWYMACGLNPNLCTLFIQSHVPAHTEMGWILGTFTQMGELERMTQYKDKAARHKENVNGGLFTYPSLMAADILLYNTHEVPVGEDQKQHLELTRNICQRVNNVYGEDTFMMPEVIIPKAGARVKDLQEPTKKMSKSTDSLGTIFLLDDIKLIEKKMKKAVTDSLGEVNWDAENQPGVTNLLTIYAACKGITPEEATTEWQGSQYGPFKKAVTETVCETIAPLQTRYTELMADKAELHNTLVKGADKATEVANETLAKLKERMGYVLR